MPSTINGIGTTYFGKRNRRQFDGVCQYCHQAGRLENYETWLVFSVVFIPVVPLGKKQVLNYCSRCTRHNVVDYSKWQQMQNEAVEAAAAELARTSHDPDAAIRMHATYDAYQMHDDAARFADAMQALYGDLARVQFYLAAWHERAGRKEQAEAGFAEAHRLEPANAAYQRAVAVGHMQHGRLDEAKRMLQAFKPPSPNFEPQLFFLLAQGFQSQGRHEEAMEQFKMLAATSPAWRQERVFRKAVRQTERVLAPAESLVGRDPLLRRRSLWVAVGAAALVIAFLGASLYVRGHRRLYLVNGLQTPISVKLDDGQALQVGPQSHTFLPVAEGRHTAAVVQPQLDRPPVEFDVASPWFTGVFRNPSYIVDPTGSAVLLYQEASYAAPGENAPDGTQQWHVGEPIVTLSSLDYPFQEFPQHVQVKRRQPVRKSRLALLSLPPVQLIGAMSAFPGLSDKALPLAETHLRVSPDDRNLLLNYWALCTKQRQFERCGDFVAARLADRPVRIDWHRIWQTVRKEQNKDDELVRQYDELLSADPTNSALAYLRGRLEQSVEASREYCARAIAADPSSPYPHFAQAVGWQNRGELRKARDSAAIAVRLSPDDMQMKYALGRLQFALGEYDEAEKQLRALLVASPAAPLLEEQLLAVLVVRGQTAEAEKEIEKLQQQISGQSPQRAEELTRQLRHSLLYMQGKFDELLAAAEGQQGDAATRARWQAQFELGKPDNPPAGVEMLDEGQEPFVVLCQALALESRGDEAAAEQARSRALDELRRGPREHRDTADVLAKSGTATQADLDQLPHDPRLRAISLVSLAANSERPDPSWLDQAETLNFDRRFPYHFLRRTIERLRQSAATERAEAE